MTARNRNTLAGMLEELNFAYTDVYTGKAQTGEINAQVSLNEVYSKLSTEIKNHIYTVDGTSTISLVNSNQSSITLLNDAEAIGSTGTAGQNTISVEIHEERESTSYYLESDGIYYPMSIRNSRVELDKENATTDEPEGTERLGDGITIGYIDNGATEETESSNYVTASRSISGTTITITITAKANAEGRTQVVVRDGSVTLTGNIDVTVNPTYTISIGAVTNGSIGITTNGENTTSNTKYGKDVEIVLTATGNTTPKKYAFEKWNDENTENPRTIQVSSTTAGTYAAIFVEAKLYGATVQLNGGNLITVKESNTIEDNWRLFYIDNELNGYVHLIYGDYYPANVQTEITSGSTIFAPAHKDLNNNESSNSSYAWTVNSQTDRLTLLKYLKNNRNYAVANLDASSPAGSYESWTNLATALTTGTEKALNGKTIRVQGSPNITMWVNSWNEQGYTRLALDASGNSATGYNVRFSTAKPNSNSNYYLDLYNDAGCSDTLYFPYKGSSSSYGMNADKAEKYWLASPGGEAYKPSWTTTVFQYNLCMVTWTGIWAKWHYSNDGTAARPVISILKSDFKNLFPNISIEK